MSIFVSYMSIFVSPRVLERYVPRRHTPTNPCIFSPTARNCAFSPTAIKYVVMRSDWDLSMQEFMLDLARMFPSDGVLQRSNDCAGAP